jgi:hypothetical protein
LGPAHRIFEKTLVLSEKRGMKLTMRFFVKRGRALGVVLAAGVFAAAAFGQETNLPPETSADTPPAAAEAPAAQPEQPKPAAGPLLDEISGIELGMTVDQVRDKLGKPETQDDASMFYDLDDGKQVQLRLDGNKKVMMVAGIFTGDKAAAPEFNEVFGSAVAAPSEENGTVYKLVRYPDAGYWIAFSRLSLKDGPMTTVTIQKIE